MTITVRLLAEWVRGEVLGDGDLAITNARPLADAQPGDITFVDSDKNLGAWHASKASAAVAPVSVPVNGRPLIRVADPLMAFARIVQRLRGRPQASAATIDPTACIHPTARVGTGVTLGPHTVVGENAEIGSNCTLHAGVAIGRGCKVGDDVVLYQHVVVYDECVIGNRVIVHANSVIGADGFGYRTQNGQHVKVPQLGWVEIEDDVEIGACSTIDRGTFGPTRIGAGTKIDNLVMVAHNCQIGRHNILAAQVGIAGSTTTGDYVIMGGQVGVSDHVHIGNRVLLGAKSGVMNDLPDDIRAFGFPARPETAQKRIWVTIDHLPELRREVKRIKDFIGLEDAE